MEEREKEKIVKRSRQQANGVVEFTRRAVAAPVRSCVAAQNVCDGDGHAIDVCVTSEGATKRIL